MQLLRLWGKTTSEPELFHPALFHMLDVGHVAQQLLSARASGRWRRVLGRAFGADPAALYGWVPWFVALHDIGKLSVPFQALSEDQRKRLASEGVPFGGYLPLHRELRHPMMGRLVLTEWAGTFPPNWRSAFLEMVSGHHGRYASPERKERGLLLDLAEPPQWAAWRAEANDLLRQHFLLAQPAEWPQPSNLSAAIVALNGFAILCDWLGSDAEYFLPRSDMSLADYLPLSERQAQRCVEEAGFFGSTLSARPTAFGQLFGFAEPRPLQTAIDAVPAHLLTEPTLTIIEAPTGEGKTEAALALAHRIAAAQGSDELYVALPTTATSDAMYQRIQRYLRDQLELPPGAVQLIHGQAFLTKDDLRIAPLSNGDDAPLPTLTWLEPKKRALLAPFGVGTVDQAELAALNVRHNALRLIGLAGKVVILDEVHAYDTYMTTIIERMLQWLAALGSSVILLSATLPAARRNQLAAAYTGTAPPLEMGAAYPYVLVAGPNGLHEANPPTAGKQIALQTLNFDEEDWAGKARWLLDQVAEGGCVCWITNLVARAQNTFAALLALAPDDVDCTLLHAAFPLDQRQAIEADVNRKYGRDEIDDAGHNPRPRKGIVIGTQVLEQSLDLDFDVMVTDLAPIDLILQRLGRLHRHARTNRSDAHPEARAYVNYEQDESGQLLLGHDKFYGPYLLLRSRQLIDRRAADPGHLALPEDYRLLVDAVYDEQEPAADDAWHAAWAEQNRQRVRYEDEAMVRLSGYPDPARPFYKGARNEFKEDEDGFGWIVAQTRFQERETLTVIPIERRGNAFGYTPLTGAIALDHGADRDSQLALLRHGVRVSNPAAVAQIKATQRTALFEQSALLERVWPLWLRADGTAEDAPLRLDEQLGLVVIRNSPPQR